MSSALERGGSSSVNGRFELLTLLGEGSFGAVYEAVDVRTKQHFALKELAHASPENLALFKQEFRTLADVHHPNVAGLHELIEEDGRWFILMELIPGRDFTSWVKRADGSPRYDEGRLRSALAGVVEGLSALHERGILHRDLKPSNVRVRPDGRAVLLDFGLAIHIGVEHPSAALAVGTARYMAPEQARGDAVGPAADLYALGVCLFEALTGRTPFDGAKARSLMLEKQNEDAPPPRAFAPDVPADLNELAVRLLARDPAERPSAEHVLSVLGGQRDEKAAAVHTPPQPFAGREPELEHLSRALDATHQGTLRVVLVEGESGVGKSELVTEFLRQMSAENPKLIALRGRCYENEQVPYKAFDGCIDELARLLERMASEDAVGYMPAHAALLGQLFPVLRKVRAIAEAPRSGSSADPGARRREAFAALAALFARLAEERPLILVLDDLQWADAESFQLLSALTEHAPPLLVLGTIRPREELEPDVHARVTELRALSQTSVLPLFGLPRAQAKQLARHLLGASAPEPWLDVIADESAGHPLFLSELSQYTRSHDFAARERLTLEAALRARIERLEPRARELLELCALAGRPHGGHVFARALGEGSLDDVTRALLTDKLLRLRKGHELGCYHDRIRHAVGELIPRTRLAARHRQLANALASAPETDVAEQARHWDQAGEREHALAAYELAVARAHETLAFARAADLCAHALALLDHDKGERAQRLTTQRAHALACAGQSGPAALLYQEAADRAFGELRHRLQSRAAQQLMLSANVTQGLALARSLLAELNVSMPKSVLGALLRYAWDRLWLGLRGMRIAEASRAQLVDEKRRVAVEVLDELTHVLWLASPLSILTLSTQQIRIARDLGSAPHAAVALSVRGWLTTMEGSLHKALPYFERARALLEHSGDPQHRGRQAHLEGSARLAAFDWVQGSACLERAHKLLQEHAPDWPWLLTNVRYHLGIAWYHLGEHRRIVREIDGFISEARERHDVLGFALLTGMGHGSLRHLMVDAPQAALEEREQALAAVSPEPFSFVHFGHFMGHCITQLYLGGPALLRWLDAFEARHARTPLFKSRMARDVRLGFRTQATLSAYVEAPASERPELLRTAAALAQKLTRKSSPVMRVYGLLTEAQLDALAGQRERALERARSARVLAQSLHHLTRRHALWLEGLLEGGSTGAAKQTSALDAYREQGWKLPERGLSMSLPLLPLLKAQEREPARESVRAKPRLGRYELLAPIGSGGFGNVVAARDVATGQKLALKELTRGGGRSLERFKREFRVLQDLHHENLARVEALFEHEGRWYIALELIDGGDLASYVRGAGSCDRARLARAFHGIARGLSALHEAGLVHRDLAPSNVRVTPDGRAVLVDFGLIARDGDATDSGAVGAPEYAAPEQLEGRAPAASADVYALGTCLYEVLFGRLPFVGASPAEIFAKKQRGQRPALPIEGELGVLAACCARMLASSPEARPSLNEFGSLLARLDERVSAERRRHSTPRPSLCDASEGAREVAFAGREEELARLLAAWERSRTGELTVALVSGQSGIGKSALVSEFAERLAAQYPAVRVLSSRCYENEQVALKAFDGAVDQLARSLRALSDEACEALLPKRAALLAQLFPVLSSVTAIARASKKGLPADPAARKLAAEHCFVELLVNVSARRPLALIVDDLHWADAESFSLLCMLHERRAELPLLVLLTAQPGNASDERERALVELATLPDSIALELHGLSEGASHELAEKLHGSPLAAARARALVHESKGHPLFLRELVEHELSGQHESSAPPTLEHALRARIDGFSAEARELVALAALAGRPLGVHVYARAMQRSELPRDALVSLLAHGILRRRGEHELACYHDRIRSVALARLAPHAEQQLARALASALEGEPNAEPAERAQLWERGEDRERAQLAYEQAGDRALETLAFAPAEQHYARAFALLCKDASPSRRLRLLEQRGHALVRAGRSADAVNAYREAAQVAEGEAAVRLRLLAAQHLIQSAQVDEGIRAAQTLLGELGFTLHTSDRRALAQLRWERARVRLRGTALCPRATPLDASERLILDALQRLSSPLRAVSYLPGFTLVAQYLRRALDSGHPAHAARALAFEGLFRALSQRDDEHEALFAQSEQLAEAENDPALSAEIELLRGLSCISANRFAAAPVHLAKAHELLQTRCPGEPWLLTAARKYLGASWFYTGDLARIARHGGQWVDEARARSDRYALSAWTGFGCASMRFLLVDEPETALEEIREAMASWPELPFSTNHFGAFNATGVVLAYAGDERLLRWLDADAPRRKRSFLMRTPACRLSESALLASGLEFALVDARGSAREALLQRLETTVRAIERVRTAGGRGMASLHRGILQAARGDQDGARLAFGRANRELDAIGHHLASAARYLEGVVEGGDAGREKRAAIEQMVRRELFRDPTRGLYFRVPGLCLLEPR